MITKPYIICSAIYINDNKEHSSQPINVDKGFVVTGRRHGDCFATIKALGISIEDWKLISKDTLIQGFITSDNRFLNRGEAYKLAVKCRQVKHKPVDNDVCDWLGIEENDRKEILASEDLY